MKINNETLKFIVVVLVVVNLCMFIFFQFLRFKYQAEFLIQPCDLCTKLNPKLSSCFDDKLTVRTVNGIEVPDINLSGINLSGIPK